MVYMNEVTEYYRQVYTNSKGIKKSKGTSWYKTHNLADKYYTTGQILIDYQFMLDKTIAELKERITDRPIIVVDPCCGRKALEKDYDNVEWKLYDLEPETEDTTQADFLELQIDYKPDLIVCNPPFTLKKQFAAKCLQLCDNVIFISPPNCLPYYDYSIKMAYSLDFMINTYVGLWHYDKSKNNTKRFTNAIDYRHCLESWAKTISYDDYMAIPDKEKYFVFVSSYYFCDVRHIETVKRSPLRAPSLIDCFKQKEDIEIEPLDGLYTTFNPLDIECWKSKATNAFIKKGQTKKGYLLKLKEGVTADDVVKFYENNKKKLAIRACCMNQLGFAKSFPLTEEEALELFEPINKKRKRTK